jgi:hypothetical protein
MRTLIFVFFMAVSFPALACSPMPDPRPLAERIEPGNFFIGQVRTVSDDEVVFAVITPGGPAGNTASGEDISFKVEEFGTCGHKVFESGQVWLYDGNSISFGDGQLLVPSDLKDGTDLETVKRNLVARLDPGYTPPRIPTKEDLPVAGIYAAPQSCAASLPGDGKANYTLTVSEPDTVTRNYTVDVVSDSCGQEPACRFHGVAPAYGYGEIVLPLETGNSSRNCSLLVQQLSSPQEWPRLKAGEARVRLNDSSCITYLAGCGPQAPVESPVLRKQ